MANTHLLVLVCYLLLVLTYTILAFVNGKGKETQVRNTIVVFIMLILPPLSFCFSLLKLYVYFKDTKADKNE